MKRLIFGVILATLLMAITGNIDAKKKATRKKAKTESTTGLSAVERRVLGKHLLTLQWISWESYGSVTIKKEADGTLSCRGEQLARNCPKGTEQGNIDNDDYVKLDGTIEIVDKDHLIFNGEIRTKVYHINNGQEVLRQGTFNFVTKENRHYWRMQEQLNPADECTDYIDIYYSK